MNTAVIDLSANSHDFLISEVPNGLLGESSLVDLAFQAVSRIDTQYSPIVLVGDQETGLCRWINLAISLAKSLKSQNSISTFTFRGREFSQSVNHAVTTKSLGEFRERLDDHQIIIFEYPSQLKVNQTAYTELIAMIDRARTTDQLIIVTMEASLIDQESKGDPLLSRLSDGLLLKIAQPPVRLKASYLTERLAVWLPDVDTKLIAQILQRPIATWSQWKRCIEKIEADLMTTGHWSADLEAYLTEEVEVLEPKLIGQHVSRIGKIKWSDLKGHSRRQSLVRMRGVCIYLIRELTSTSFESIGHLLGNRDHSTIIHAYRKIESSRHNDIELENLLEDVCRSLKTSLPNKPNFEEV